MGASVNTKLTSTHQVFHSAVVQETKRRAQNVFVDEEELESRNFAKAVEGEALDLDKELEKAILERAREAGNELFDSLL